MVIEAADGSRRNEVVENDWDTVRSWLNVELQTVGPHLDRSVERRDGVLGACPGRASMCDVRRVPVPLRTRRTQSRSRAGCDALRKLASSDGRIIDHSLSEGVTFLEACSAGASTRVSNSLDALGDMSERVRDKTSFEEVLDEVRGSSPIADASVDRLRELDGELPIEESPPAETVEVLQEQAEEDTELPEEGSPPFASQPFTRRGA